ncbi:MAG: ATP-binding protein [Anaerolineae bacterium]
MKQMVILSGKGGTGKTTVAVALAHLMSQHHRVVVADADVDAPNMEIILRPEMGEAQPFSGGQLAVIDPDLCTSCGRCNEVCRFEAIRVDGDVYSVDPLSCEGCGACVTQCPAGAIDMTDRQSGFWYRSETRFGTFIHARLGPGEANSGKLVSRVRAEALATGAEQNADWVLIDGSPGIGCPVIAAISGVDLALLVAEPTVSGWHDLQRALAVAEHFRTPAMVCINKSDINPTMTEHITAECQERQIPVLAHLPYDETAVRAMRALVAVTELPANPVADAIRQVYRSLDTMIQRPG